MCDCLPTMPLADAAALGSSDEGMPKGMLAAIVVGSVTGVVLPALVVVLLMRRMRDRNRNLLGRVTAPRAGPDTTLLISGERREEGCRDSGGGPSAV